MMADPIEGPTQVAIEELGAIANKLAFRIQDLLLKLNTKKDSDALVKQLANASKIHAQVLAQIEEFGYRATLRVAQREAINAAALYIADLKLQGFEPDYRAVWAQVSNGIGDKLKAPWIDAGEAVRLAVNQATAGGLPIGGLLARIAKEMDITKQQSQTVVQAAIKGTASQSMVEASKDSPNAFKYRYTGGGLDDRTRDFCRHLLRTEDKLYTLAEIQEMDNGQGLDVLQYGGGYRCRHRWAARLAD